MKKVLAIFALCLFGFYGAMQGQALAGSEFDATKKTPLMARPEPTSGDQGGAVKKP